jgi:hypothetical protein
MSAFSLPLVVFTGFMIALLLAVFWGAFDDDTPQRAAMTWAVTCPLSGLLFGVGLAPLAIITGVVSVLALGSLAYWFLAPASDDTDDDAEEVVDPDPGPSDDAVLDPPTDDEPDAPDSGPDWDEFDRLRVEWEREREPLPGPLPERV